MHYCNVNECPVCNVDNFKWGEEDKCFVCRNCGCKFNGDGFIISTACTNSQDKAAIEDIEVEHTYITDVLIKYCSEHPELSLVANGQEEVRLLTDIEGKHIYVLQGKGAIVSARSKKDFKNVRWGYLCVFDDEYDNLYFEVEYKGQRYNVPAEIFDQGRCDGIPGEPPPDPVADCCGCQTFSE